MKLWVKILIGVGSVLIIGAIVLGVFMFTRGGRGIDINNPPQFIQADFIDLSKIYSLSKFRSGAGHDFSGNGETCRSMKHYYMPNIDPNLRPEKNSDGRTLPPKPDGVTDIPIYSPVDGKITQITSERTPIGEQIYITPDSQRDVTIRLFHIYKLDGITNGTHVTAGQQIGIIGKNQGTDIAIEVGRLPWQRTYVSYFQVMPDNIFASYEARGVKSRDELIISKEYRDAHPLQCGGGETGEEFIRPNGYDNNQDEVHLSGYVAPKQGSGNQNGNSSGNQNSGSSSNDTSEPPVLLKNIGVNIADYNPATNKAGDFQFTKADLLFDDILSPYGFVVPGNSANGGKEKQNPQPTYRLPLGTKVLAPIDGVVAKVPKLYSNDYSIQISDGVHENWLYEMEHVSNPLVKEGDRVTAGQVIAEVSPQDKDAYGGLGVVELGILHGGNPPTHICPFAYLDPSVKDTIFTTMAKFFKSWEQFRGDSTIYDESKMPVMGCLTTNPIEG